MKQLYICPYCNECNINVEDCGHSIPHEHNDTCKFPSCSYYEGAIEPCMPYEIKMNRNGANE